MTKKKDETKNDPPRTDDEAPGPVTMDTKVAEGGEGMARLRALARRILRQPGRENQST